MHLDFPDLAFLEEDLGGLDAGCDVRLADLVELLDLGLRVQRLARFLLPRQRGGQSRRAKAKKRTLSFHTVFATTSSPAAVFKSTLTGGFLFSSPTSWYLHEELKL